MPDEARSADVEKLLADEKVIRSRIPSASGGIAYLFVPPRDRQCEVRIVERTW